MPTQATTPGSQKSGGAGLGLCSWLLLSNVDTAQLALRNSCPGPALPCPVPLPAGLHACLGQKTTKYMVARVRFPAIANTRRQSEIVHGPGGIARQEESCISFPSVFLLLLRLSLHDNHIPTIQQYTFDLHSTRSCSLTAISISISVSARPFFVHLTHNSSVAYLELQRSSLPPTTPTTSLVNNRRCLCVLGARAVSSFQCRPAQGSKRILSTAKKQTAPSAVPTALTAPIRQLARQGAFDVPPTLHGEVVLGVSSGGGHRSQHGEREVQSRVVPYVPSPAPEYHQQHSSPSLSQIPHGQLDRQTDRQTD